jgi:hypothetical protein
MKSLFSSMQNNRTISTLAASTVIILFSEMMEFSTKNIQRTQISEGKILDLQEYFICKNEYSKLIF